MKLLKNIYLNNKKINTFEIDGNNAKVELINLLFNKINKKNKISIYKDIPTRSIKAYLYFNHNLHNGIANKYEYEYIFTNIENEIDLY